MSMPIWVCLTRRRTSDILELTIKKTLLHRAEFFCGAGEERNRRRSYRQRARRRAEERSTLYFSPRFSCFRLHPAYKKRDPKRSLSFVELEKKGTASGRSASERGDEPRSGTLPTSPLSHASDSRQFHKKRPLSGGHFSVELEGVEPSSKQVTDVLSTCLSYG